MPTYRVEGFSLYKQAKGWFEIITNGDFAGVVAGVGMG